MGELASEHLSAGTATSAYCCSMPASRITLRASGTLNLSLADFRNIDAHQKPWRDNETFGKWRDKIANSVPPVTGPVWMAVSDTLRDQVSTLRGDQVITVRDQVIWRLAVLDPTGKKEPEDVLDQRYWDRRIPPSRRAKKFGESVRCS